MQYAVSAANDKVWEPRLKWFEFELSVVMAKEKGEQDEEEGARFKYSKTGTGVAEQEVLSYVGNSGPGDEMDGKSITERHRVPIL